MLDLQDQMNSKVDPNWREANNEWYRAIWVECAEMMDHVGYKWWKKKGAPNVSQIHLEIVDVMHFMLAIALLNKLTPETIARELTRDSGTPPTLTDSIDRLAYEQLEGKNRVVRFNNLSVVMQLASMDFNELFKQYCAKNVLNIFRQDNGYKEGTYHKQYQLDGKTMEDNEALAKLLHAYTGTEENFMAMVKEDLNTLYGLTVEYYNTYK